MHLHLLNFSQNLRTYFFLKCSTKSKFFSNHNPKKTFLIDPILSELKCLCMLAVHGYSCLIISSTWIRRTTLLLVNDIISNVHNNLKMHVLLVYDIFNNWWDINLCAYPLSKFYTKKWFGWARSPWFGWARSFNLNWLVKYFGSCDLKRKNFLGLWFVQE